MVQIAEDLDLNYENAPTDEKTVIKKAIDFLDSIGKPHYITEIGKERIRRAGKKIKEDTGLTAADLDIGFRVLKLDSSNMEDVYYAPDKTSQDDLLSLISNIKPDRTPEDLLFQVMLEFGITLDSKIEETVISGKKVFKVAGNFLIACFDENVTDDVVKAIAQATPAYAVLRDSSFANDSVAANFEQIFATYSPDTVRRVL
jgi:adenine-specific DNA-methyltransferase